MIGRSGKKRQQDYHQLSRGNSYNGGDYLLAIKLMRTGAKKRPSYRVIVKEKQSNVTGVSRERRHIQSHREPAEII